MRTTVDDPRPPAPQPLVGRRLGRRRPADRGLVDRRAGAAIDPRIRGRQIAVRRAARRRRLCLVTAGLVAVGVILAAWGATRSPLLDVDRVLIEGAVQTGDAPVRAAAHIGHGTAMTDVDGAGAARRVSRLPWVRHVQVVRDWPSTVHIRVVEREAVAVTRASAPARGAAATGEAVAPWVLVDRFGRVLASVASPPAGVVIVDGVPPAGAPGAEISTAARQALDVAAQLPPGLAPRVATVTLGAKGVELRLKPQGVVVLGGDDDTAAKLRATQTVLAAVDGRTVSTLDVRIPATPVLTQL